MRKYQQPQVKHTLNKKTDNKENICAMQYHYQQYLSTQKKNKDGEYQFRESDLSLSKSGAGGGSIDHISNSIQSKISSSKGTFIQNHPSVISMQSSNNTPSFSGCKKSDAVYTKNMQSIKRPLNTPILVNNQHSKTGLVNNHRPNQQSVSSTSSAQVKK